VGGRMLRSEIDGEIAKGWFSHDAGPARRRMANGE
jgi:hypothetical protein